MTPERFEELVETAFAAAAKGEFGCEPSEIVPSLRESIQISIRTALTAIFPLVRNDVIEECAVIVEDDDGHFTWSGEDKHVRLLQGFASDAAEAIRALKSKDTKL